MLSVNDEMLPVGCGEMNLLRLGLCLLLMLLGQLLNRHRYLIRIDLMGLRLLLMMISRCRNERIANNVLYATDWRWNAHQW